MVTLDITRSTTALSERDGRSRRQTKATRWASGIECCRQNRSLFTTKWQQIWARKNWLILKLKESTKYGKIKPNKSLLTLHKQHKMNVASCPIFVLYLLVLPQHMLFFRILSIVQLSGWNQKLLLSRILSRALSHLLVFLGHQRFCWVEQSPQLIYLGPLDFPAGRWR